MKISSIIWLKSFGGNVGRVYTSRIYAIEFEDSIGYESMASILGKKRSAGYIERAAFPDHLGYGVEPMYLTKHWNPSGTITDGMGHSYEVLGITKNLNPTAEIDEGIGYGVQPLSISKRLGGYYIVKTLPADLMESASIITAIEKSRKVLDSAPMYDEMGTVSTATNAYKVRKVILGSDMDAVSFDNAVSAIIKTSKYMSGGFYDGADIGSMVTEINLHKNPSSHNVEPIATTNIALSLSKKLGKGYLIRYESDKIESGSVLSTISKRHPFIYKKEADHADFVMTAFDIEKTRKVLVGFAGDNDAMQVAHSVRSIIKRTLTITGASSDFYSAASTAFSVQKIRRSKPPVASGLKLNLYTGYVPRSDGRVSLALFTPYQNSYKLNLVSGYVPTTSGKLALNLVSRKIEGLINLTSGYVPPTDGRITLNLKVVKLEKALNLATGYVPPNDGKIALNLERVTATGNLDLVSGYAPPTDGKVKLEMKIVKLEKALNMKGGSEQFSDGRITLKLTKL